MFVFRDSTYQRTETSNGWWENFRARNPNLSIRTPSLIDTGRHSMSRKDVMDVFFENARTFLADNNLLDKPGQIFNIDETWFAPTDEKQRKVVVPSKNPMAYKVFGGSQGHLTLAMCACADGQWKPSMFIYKGNVPSSNEFHEQGPPNSIFTATESGHMDTNSYLEYIKHLEPHLGPNRPICIFQDNLSSHESFELVDFCMKHGILLYNFPAKVSHLIQPMDKLFGPLKSKFEQKRAEACLIQQRYVTNAKIPIICRFAMDAISSDTIRNAFKTTGIYPLDRSAISDELLVGTNPVPTTGTVRSKVTSVVPETSLPSMGLTLQVFDENNDEPISDRPSKYSEKQIQTDNITTLPCEICIKNDVRVHPAVASGAVDFTLASVFIPDSVTRQETTKRRTSRDCSKGRCLTTESELERLRQRKEEESKKELAKKRRIEQKQKNKDIKEQQERLKRIRKEKKQQQKSYLEQAENRAKHGKLRRGTCATCGVKPDTDGVATCVLCNIKFHKNCIDETSFATTCQLCISK